MSNPFKNRRFNVVPIRRRFDFDIIDGMLSVLGIEITEELPRSYHYDGRALAADWSKIGRDIRHSMETYSREKALV